MDKEELLLKLGNKIRYERMRKKLSQEELAEMANINMRSISTIECGLTDIKFTTLTKIAEALNIETTSLIDFRL
mgnify:CR=1 FL=1